MHPNWQKINALWLFCHWWPDRNGRMISAMTYLILLLVVAALMAAETLRLLRHDGRGPQRPPASHFDDPRFRSPAAGC
jgi:hypothetical protein